MTPNQRNSLRWLAAVAAAFCVLYATKSFSFGAATYLAIVALAQHDK